MPLQGIHDASDVHIEVIRHRHGKSAFLVLDVLESLQVRVRCLRRSVDRIERNIQEKRFLVVAVDKGDRFPTEGVGQILGFLDRRPVAQDRIVGFVDLRTETTVGAVVRGAVDESKELVVATGVGMEFGRIAGVAFADHTRGVAKVLHAFGQRSHLGRNADLDVLTKLVRAGIVLRAEPVLVDSRPEARPRRTTHRPTHIPRRELHPVACDRVNMRRHDIGAAVIPHVGIPQIIGKKDHHIRPFAGTCSEGRANQYCRHIPYCYS